ncbi:hypothetical protein SETIT_6G183200v2 [Setaria italica]|uniref:Uncharacterized protein n=1 Tax=Setaria italica TaxID=4555 RepID=A0A368RN14_SETIT|nr:hypothetical protein SETIT_6G183200v2 [Setaria italica]
MKHQACRQRQRNELTTFLGTWLTDDRPLPFLQRLLCPHPWPSSSVSCGCHWLTFCGPPVPDACNFLLLRKQAGRTGERALGGP